MTGKSYRYFELAFHARLPASPKKDLLEAILKQHGFSESEWAVSFYKSKFKICLFLSDLRRSQRLQHFVRQHGMRGFHLTIRCLNKKDWFDKWKETYRSFNLGRSIRVIPAWEKSSRPVRNRSTIWLDPGASFGSGTHETTRLVVQAMESLSGKFRSFVDAGTGTGILCLCAKYLGADHIEGFDYDAISVADAKVNLKLNRMEDIRLFHQDIKTLRARQRYDLVTANMISKTLIDFQKPLAALVRPGQYLIVSGILRRNLKGFLRDFKPAAMHPVRRIQGRSWACIIYQKRA